jgi:hypothetical protein
MNPSESFPPTLRADIFTDDAVAEAAVNYGRAVRDHKEAKHAENRARRLVHMTGERSDECARAMMQARRALDAAIAKAAGVAS